MKYLVFISALLFSCSTIREVQMKEVDMKLVRIDTIHRSGWPNEYWHLFVSGQMEVWLIRSDSVKYKTGGFYQLTIPR